MKEIKIFRKGNSYASAKINLPGLLRLQENFGKKLVTYVGILGSNTRQTKEVGETKEPLNNATIGMVHEFGSYSRGIPERSFLRMPLMLHLKEAVDESVTKINAAIQSDNIVKAYALLGAAAEKVIQDAFRTRGFGHWAPNAPSTIARKGSDSPLIDTHQLKDSITSKVATV